MRARAWVCLGLLVPVAFTAAVGASDVPIPVKIYLNKAGSKTKLLSKGTFVLPDPGTDNPVSEGGAITFSEGVASETILLPASGWSALGNPPGSKGFKYRDASGASCKKVLVKGTAIKALCKATAPGAPPFDAGSDPPVSIVLAIGTGTAQRYCAECPNGGEQKGNPNNLTKLKGCLAPATCPPEVPFPTPTPTPTVGAEGLCCDFPSGCSSAPSLAACLKLTGGNTVGGGAVCDVSGNCVSPPGSPGDCCEGDVPIPLCTMVVHQATCEGGGGTFHASSICDPSGSCMTP